MNKLIPFVFLLFLAMKSPGQITHGSLQATGLTCALCSNAINKALKALPFIDSVKANVKTSGFAMVFKSGTDVNPDAIRKAVEDAGFFVGGLALTVQVRETAKNNGSYLKLGQRWFRVLGQQSGGFTGSRVLYLQDKGFLTAKEFKKVSARWKLPGLETGKAGKDAGAAGIKEGDRVYHVRM